MPSNIEIKARVNDISKLRKLAKSLATETVQLLLQEDIFYNNKNGRLKLRIFSENLGNLIHYERPNASNAKLSSYLLYETKKPIELRNLLSTSLGEIISVKKKREVYIVGQTRVHLDEVEELGTFMELEVALLDKQTANEGKLIIANLMEKLEISSKDLVSVAYADLLMEKQTISNE